MHTTERSSSVSYNCFVDFVDQSSRISENVFLFAIFYIYFYFFVLFQKRVPGFHQVSKSEKTFETTFGNLMKPEARVFEITSPTKKISRNYNFNKWIQTHQLFETWNVRTCHLLGSSWCVGIQCHVSVTWLFVTSVSKHVASQYRWQSRDLDVLELVKKKKRVWPVLYLSLPDIKTNGRLAFLIICKELDFLKLQRCNRLVSVIRDLTKTTTARATGTSKK